MTVRKPRPTKFFCWCGEIYVFWDNVMQDSRPRNFTNGYSKPKARNVVISMEHTYSSHWLPVLPKHFDLEALWHYDWVFRVVRGEPRPLDILSNWWLSVLSSCHDVPRDVSTIIWCLLHLWTHEEAISCTPWTRCQFQRSHSRPLHLISWHTSDHQYLTFAVWGRKVLNYS